MSTLYNFFHALYLRHEQFWTKPRLVSFLHGICLFAVAMVIQKIADAYVGGIRGVVVPDIILDHIPTLDIDPVIVQGALILTFVIMLLLLVKPKYLTFTVKALAVFVITRSFFISLTHLGASPRELTLDTNNFGFGLYNWLYNTNGDFFFSGHTGAPYLMALIFWQEKFWRLFFIATSILFAASVLLAHIHYSIDVFAAPFITYSIFVIARDVFPKDYRSATVNLPLSN
jgi:hypothetical protein